MMLKDRPPTPRGTEPDDPIRRRPAIGPRLFILLVGVVIGALSMLLFMCVAGAQGYTQTIDGDTFVNGMGQHVRIWGIDAPELNQTCDGKPVGKMAKARLAELLKGNEVNCQPQGPTNSRDRYGRIIAICTAFIREANAYHALDIGRTLVEEGLAFNYDRYTKAYKAYEGWGPVHQYHCENPERWRHK